MKRLVFLFLLPINALAMHQPTQDSPALVEYISHCAILPYCITAFEKQNKVGYIKLGRSKINSDFGHIQFLHVDPCARGKGIGYNLFKRAIFTLIKKGFRVITWDAIGIQDVSTNCLEEVYLTYILKLKDELEFDFIMDQRLGSLEPLITPMKLTIKNWSK